MKIVEGTWALIQSYIPLHSVSRSQIQETQRTGQNTITGIDLRQFWSNANFGCPSGNKYYKFSRATS